MQINIQGHGIELTPALKEYATRKIGRVQEFFNNIQKVQITLDVRKIDDLRKSQVAEVSLWAAGKKVIRATEAAHDMYSAIDLVAAEIERQVKKHKEKHVKEGRRIGERIKQLTRTFIPSFMRSGEPALARMTRFDISNMTFSEAQAERSKHGHSFFLFRNAETGEVNVLHKNELIDPAKAKKLSEDEAVRALKASDAEFLAFMNPNTSEMNVVYKRKSGNLGLIEPAA